MENLIRKCLDENKPTVSTRLWSTKTLFVEALGSTGNYDYVEFEAEYVPYTLEELSTFCMAAELHHLGTMIKLDYQSRGYWSQKAIASGFQAINFVDCRNAGDVREAINLTMPETPRDGGHFGFPNNRFIGFNPWPSQTEHAERVRKVVRCFMIEKASAVEEIDEICSIPGVDMIQFGPSDYSLSSGFDLKANREKVMEAQRHCIEVAFSHGVRPRCEARTMEDAAFFRSLGVRDICYGDQMQQLLRDWNRDGKAIRALVD